MGFGGTPVAGFELPGFTVPEFGVCFEEYTFDLEFMGWDFGALMAAGLAVISFGLLWSIFKR